MIRGVGRLIHLSLLLPSFCLAAAAETPTTLPRLIASALREHPSVLAQQAHAQTAKAGLDSAKWQFYPTPSVAIERASASSSDTAYAGDKTVSTFRLQQPLWTGGRLTAGRDKAEAMLQVSESALEEARQQLALKVLQAYGDWLAAHLKVQATEKSLATHTRLHDQVKRRIEQGASSESDLILAMGRLSAVAAEITLVHAQKEIARSRLGQLMGRPVDEAALTAAPALPHPLDAGLPALLDLAQTGHPAIRKLRAQARVHEAVVEERRAELSPEVYARAERQHGNHSSGNTSPENRFFIGLSSRFGAGLSSLSNVEGARAELQAALAEVEQQSRLVSEQVLADYTLHTSSETRLQALRAALKAAGQVAESYDRQFLSGRKSWLDVMNAARELAQTEVQLADIEASEVVVTWRLAIHGEGLARVLEGRP